MDIFQIHCFLTLVETGNFSKAAEQLFISQPSLSARIKKLERELGIVLFQRGARQTVLTPAGQFFLTRAQKFFEDYQAIKIDLEKFKQQPILRIGTLRTIRSLNLAQLISKFRKQYPDVTLKMYSGYLEDLETWLATGVIDVALTWVQKIDESKTSLFLFQQELQLIVNPNHVLAQQNTVQMTDLHKQNYIERANCEFKRSCVTVFESLGVEPMLVYSANEEELVILLVQANLGVSIMPFWRNVRNLRYIPIDDLNMVRNIGLKWRNKIVSKQLNDFREFAANHNWQV